MSDPLECHRDELLAQVEATGWPEVVVPGIAYVVGELSWRAAIECATCVELIALYACVNGVGSDNNEEAEAQ